MWLDVPSPAAKVEYCFCRRHLIRAISFPLSSWSRSCLKAQTREFLGVLGVDFPTGSSHHLQQSSCHSQKRFPLIPFLLRPSCSPPGEFSASLRGRLWKALVLRTVCRPAASASPVSLLNVQTLRSLLCPSELEPAFNKVPRWWVGTVRCEKPAKELPSPFVPSRCWISLPWEFCSFSLYPAHILFQH